INLTVLLALGVICGFAVARLLRRHEPEVMRKWAPVTYTVEVLGGRLVITEHPDGEIEMTGPAVIVAEGEFASEWLETAIA
ncbi:hypothetical protein ABZ366_20485, partial [Streptomyces sp. NPDC005904]